VTSIVSDLFVLKKSLLSKLLMKISVRGQSVVESRFIRGKTLSYISWAVN